MFAFLDRQEVGMRLGLGAKLRRELWREYTGSGSSNLHVRAFSPGEAAAARSELSPRCDSMPSSLSLAASMSIIVGGGRAQRGAVVPEMECCFAGPLRLEARSDRGTIATDILVALAWRRILHPDSESLAHKKARLALVSSSRGRRVRTGPMAAAVKPGGRLSRTVDNWTPQQLRPGNRLQVQ